MRAKVAQILRNLVSNALKFTERGEVRVLARHDPGSDRITVAVRDSGIGIAPEHHSHIFEEFAQVDSRIQRGVRGTGLGLPLSRRLAELLGGTIALEARPAMIDVRASYPTAPGAGRRRGRRSGAFPSDPRRRRRPDVPLRAASDDRWRSRGDRSLRRKPGAGGDPQRAADVVLLDLEMPILDGYAVLDALSHDPATRDLPVVVVTSAVLGLAERRRLVDAAAVLAKDGLTKEIIGAALRDSTALREDRADGAR
jgi:CheY-like chemotaxis protein